jgi:F420-dependent oxidoreductase-like protein
LQIPRFDWPGGEQKLGETLAEIARTADEGGFASIWVMDHFFQMEGFGRAEDFMLEGYTTLGYLAAVTKRVTLGTLVTGVQYRYPGVLMKIMTTLDVLSGGRAWLGIGAGWYERESRGLGVPFPPTKVRFEQLEEALQIAHQVWAGDSRPYQGKHFQLAEPINQPRPASQPRPRIMIGGGGEQKTLRLVAQYADACNLFAYGDIGQIAHKLDVLKQHCEAIGRDYDEIERTLLVSVGRGATDLNIPDLIERCRAWAGLGIQHILLSDVPRIYEIEPVARAARELIPAVAQL